MLRTMLDEQIANGTHITPSEQSRLSQEQVDTAEARSRMLIINQSVDKLNPAQRKELTRHNSLGGTHCFKPFGDSTEDFSYVTTA